MGREGEMEGEGGMEGGREMGREGRKPQKTEKRRGSRKEKNIISLDRLHTRLRQLGPQSLSRFCHGK